MIFTHFCVNIKIINSMYMENNKSDSVKTDVTIAVESFDIYVNMVTKLLTGLIQEHGNQPCQSIFNCQQKPTLDISAYIRRINNFTQFSSECLLIAVVYFDRYHIRKEKFTLSEMNLHRLYLGCLLLATKFQDDFYYDNKSFELAGGISTEDLLSYELQISQCLDFNLYVLEEEYFALLNRLKLAYGMKQQSEIFNE